MCYVGFLGLVLRSGLYNPLVNVDNIGVEADKMQIQEHGKGRRVEGRAGVISLSFSKVRSKVELSLMDEE